MSDPGVTFVVYRLQVARVVHRCVSPATLPRLGLADDVVNLVRNRDTKLAALAVRTLTQAGVSVQDALAEYTPSLAVSTLVAGAARRVVAPAIVRGGC